MQFALVPIFATRWRYLHLFQIWPWNALLALPVSVEWNIIVQRPTSRFVALHCFWSKGKGKRPPEHCSFSPRSGQAAPPSVDLLITFLTLFLVFVLLLQLPQALQLSTLQSTGNPRLTVWFGQKCQYLGAQKRLQAAE